MQKPRSKVNAQRRSPILSDVQVKNPAFLEQQSSATKFEPDYEQAPVTSRLEYEAKTFDSARSNRSRTYLQGTTSYNQKLLARQGSASSLSSTKYLAKIQSSNYRKANLRASKESDQLNNHMARSAKRTKPIVSHQLQLQASPNAKANMKKYNVVPRSFVGKMQSQAKHDA